MYDFHYTFKDKVGSLKKLREANETELVMIEINLRNLNRQKIKATDDKLLRIEQEITRQQIRQGAIIEGIGLIDEEIAEYETKDKKQGGTD